MIFSPDREYAAAAAALQYPPLPAEEGRRELCYTEIKHKLWTQRVFLIKIINTACIFICEQYEISTFTKYIWGYRACSRGWREEEGSFVIWSLFQALLSKICQQLSKETLKSWKSSGFLDFYHFSTFSSSQIWLSGFLQSYWGRFRIFLETFRWCMSVEAEEMWTKANQTKARNGVNKSRNGVNERQKRG